MIQDAELKPFGWAPGVYHIWCRRCREEVLHADKRAHRCRDCAIFEKGRRAAAGDNPSAVSAAQVNALLALVVTMADEPDAQLTILARALVVACLNSQVDRAAALGIIADLFFRPPVEPFLQS